MQGKGDRTLLDQMSQEKKDRLRLLLQQLELTSDDIFPYFAEAGIEKLTVEKTTKRWHFHFVLEKILPAKVYMLFYEKLTKSFAHIANVSFTVAVQNRSFEDS